MIVYLHGFRSSPQSRKALILARHLQQRGAADQYQCPALPPSPRAAARLALELAQTTPPKQLALIGSSLGGYYATWIAEKLGCRAVLLNPAIDPAHDLQAHIGRQSVFFSDDEINFRPEYIDELRELNTPVTRPERYFLIAASGDAVIDHRKMLSRYAGARQRLIDGSNHELSDFEQYVEEVLAFCRSEGGSGSGKTSVRGSGQ
ncbi:MAG: esterase [Burkholderiaceae bacterium]|nr:esterase [Burkholderiaceae bacterium]